MGDQPTPPPRRREPTNLWAPSRAAGVSGGGTSELIDAHQTEVGGIPAFVVDGPGPLVVGLMFRVGVIDEVLPRRGLTHLVEHLTLHSIARGGSAAYNGSVGLTDTTFLVRGEDDEVVEFFRQVSRALRALPMSRAETEARVLTTEAQGRGPSAFGALAGVRYGARHAGLVDYEEYGLLDPTSAVVQEWADTYFNASNAALWVKGTIPKALHIDLISGTAHFPPDPPSPGLALPGAVYRSRGTVAMSFPTDRSAASFFALGVLHRRLHEKLRVDEGRVYAIEGTREILGAERTLVALWSKSLDSESQAVADALRAELGALATEGPTPAELQEATGQLRRAWSQPDNAVPRAVAAAASHLKGRPLAGAAQFIAELEALKPEEVAWALSDARDSALWLVPEATTISDKRISTMGVQADQGAVRGMRRRRRRWLDDASKDDELVVSHVGVSMESGFGYHRTVLFDRCEALVAWDDSRWVMGSDGFKLFVHPDEWVGGDEVVAAIDAAVPADRRIKKAGAAGSAYLREVDRLAPAGTTPAPVAPVAPVGPVPAGPPVPTVPAAGTSSSARRGFFRR